jgi:hypothetical protein
MPKPDSVVIRLEKQKMRMPEDTRMTSKKMIPERSGLFRFGLGKTVTPVAVFPFLTGLKEVDPLKALKNVSLGDNFGHGPKA